MYEDNSLLARIFLEKVIFFEKDFRSRKKRKVFQNESSALFQEQNGELCDTVCYY
jgi:hypothetical protein